MEIRVEFYQTELPDWILPLVGEDYVASPWSMWGTMVCENREAAEAIENVARLNHASDYSHIKIIGQIGADGWAAIRRAVEHLAAPPSFGSWKQGGRRGSHGRGCGIVGGTTRTLPSSGVCAEPVNEPAELGGAGRPPGGIDDRHGGALQPAA